MKLSIIICTFNRSRLLKKCIDSFVPFINYEVEIIIIDNNSQDDTAQIVNKYSLEHKNIKYFFEEKTGLSHARNRGIVEAKSKWILYIDDDAFAFPNLINRALYLVEKEDFDCIGGMYYGYYESEKPKWIPDEFGTKYKYAEDLTGCPYYVPCGGIVLYRKTMLEYLGGFSDSFGMSGSSKILGEETELQYRASKLNYEIGFDPELKVYHLVKPEYSTLNWLLKRSFLEGKTTVQIIKKNSLLMILFKNFRSFISLIFKRFPLNVHNWVSQRDYYWQNLVYDSIMPNFLFFGQLWGLLKK
jgi:glycosyltransferase involved in cell wall biosynthesis